MNKIKMVYVAYDENQIESLKTIVNENGQIELANSFLSAKAAYNYLQKNETDLLILDINHENKDECFWLVRQAKTLHFKTVFLSNTPEWAYNAFEFNALHYLVKPFTKVHLSQIIERFSKSNKAFMVDDIKIPVKGITDLFEKYINSGNRSKRLVINNIHNSHIINVDEIIQLKAEGAYTVFTLLDKTIFKASKCIKNYTDELGDHPDFVRIHRGYIINKKYVKTITKNKYKSTCIMSNGDELQVSPKKRDEILQMLV